MKNVNKPTSLKGVFPDLIFKKNWDMCYFSSLIKKDIKVKR